MRVFMLTLGLFVSALTTAAAQAAEVAKLSVPGMTCPSLPTGWCLHS